MTQQPVTLATWKVNNVPLPSGWWEGVYWADAQTARCSNDVRIKRPDHTISAVSVEIDGTPDLGGITFNVSLDVEGDDLGLWRGLQAGSVVVVEIATWNALTQNNVYIASVEHAPSGPFYVTLLESFLE